MPKKATISAKARVQRFAAALKAQKPVRYRVSFGSRSVSNYIENLQDFQKDSRKSKLVAR
jgi:hypothetical protein